MAPSPQLLEAASESDLFASGRLGITWSDFTETPKYVENGVDFGIAPFYVINEGESFVDTWTSPWGTFVDSKDQELALEFLRFIATEAQRIRPDGLGRPAAVDDRRRGDRLRPATTRSRPPTWKSSTLRPSRRSSCRPASRRGTRPR